MAGGDLLRVVRAPNIVLAAAGVCAGGWIALGRVTLTPLLCWAAISGLGLGAAGNVWNDLQDAAADRINHPGGDRPIAAGRISRDTGNLLVWLGGLVGVAAAALVSGAQVAIALIVLVAMLVYSPWLKRLGPIGNLTVAVIAGFPLFYGAMAAGRAPAGLVPWALGFSIHLARELVKDLADETGDRAVGRRTVPIRYGREAARRVAWWTCVGFVPLSIVLPLIAGYSARYFMLAVLAQSLVLLSAHRVTRNDLNAASFSLKAAMALGLAALVIGRVGG